VAYHPENYQMPSQNRLTPFLSLKSNFRMPEKPGLAVDRHGYVWIIKAYSLLVQHQIRK
jgi:hypothetical protein